jgi:hypothetical protein
MSFSVADQQSFDLHIHSLDPMSRMCRALFWGPKSGGLMAGNDIVVRGLTVPPATSATDDETLLQSWLKSLPSELFKPCA